MPRGDQQVVLAELKMYYLARGVDRVATTHNIPTPVDTVVRFELFKSPKLTYAQAMDFVFRENPRLKRAYGESCMIAPQRRSR
jgi:hypothetical protein